MKLGLKEHLWYQTWRPKTVEECILPQRLKTTFQNIVKSGKIQDFLFCGRSGVGKTTLALALVNELDYDHYFVNSSMKGNIDTLRNEIQEFASSISIMNRRKVVILDEADNLTHSTQLALRAFMEEFSSNCSFILTCNYPNRIVDGLKSRCSVVEFNIPKNEYESIFKQYLISTLNILKKEQIDFDPSAVALAVKELFPDFRSILNKLQEYSNYGKIDMSIISSLKNDEIIELIKLIKSRNFDKVKQWIFDHQDIEFEKIVELIYEVMPNYLDNSSIPNLILHLNKYQYQHSFVVNKLLNSEACLVEIMMDSNIRFN